MQVTGLTGVAAVAAVAAGEGHSLAVESGGTAWAWGWNGSGQLGDGTTTNRTTPTQVSGLGGSVPCGVVQVLPPAGLPSSDCEQAGGQQVVDLSAQGVHTKLYVLPRSASAVDVCFRVSSATTGEGAGGKVAIAPAVPDADVTGVELPTIGPPSQDANATACTTTTDPPNQVPGSHPMIGGGVAGQPVMVDSYFNSEAAWVCLQTGTAVNTRVALPVTPPSVGVPGITMTPAYSVTITPDPGTPGT